MLLQEGGYSYRPERDSLPPLSARAENSFTQPKVEGFRIMSIPPDKKKPDDSGFLLPQPAIIHFGGFRVQERASQTLRILNNSGRSLRMVVVAPKKSRFSIKLNKKGLVAPGMSQDIEVFFKGEELKYFTDTIQVSCEFETVTIPIHAYPTLNKAVFPSFINIGSCVVGESKKHTISIECEMPMRFDYKVTVVEGSSEFQVGPLSGSMQPNGSAELNVIYTARSLSTSSITLRLDVAQYMWKPLFCRVSATGRPYGWTKPSVQEEVEFAKTLGRTAHKAFAKAFEHKEQTTTTGGVARKDKNRAVASPAAQQAQLSRATNARFDFALGAGRTAAPATAYQGGGIQVPERLTAQSDVNFLLTQQPGKMKIADIRTAIAASQSAYESEQAEADAIQGGEGSRGPGQKHKKRRRRGSGKQQPHHPSDYSEAALRDLEFQGEKIQMKSLLFARGLSELAAHEKSLQINPTRPRKGQKRLTEQDQAALQAAKDGKRDKLRRSAREEDRACTTPASFASIAVAGLAAQAVAAYGATAAAPPPSFDVAQGDNWGARRRVLGLFTQAATTQVVRSRVRQRIAMLAANRSLGATPLARSAAGAGQQQAEEEEGEEEEVLLGLNISREAVAGSSFPMVPDGDDAARWATKVEVDTLPADFFQVNAFAPKEPLEYLMLGYAPLLPPELPAWTPLFAEPMRSGAAEEVMEVGPSGVSRAGVGELKSAMAEASSMSKTMLARTQPMGLAAEAEAEAEAKEIKVRGGPGLQSSVLQMSLPDILLQQPPVGPTDLLRSHPSLVAPPELLSVTKVSDEAVFAFQPLTLPPHLFPAEMLGEVGAESMAVRELLLDPSLVWRRARDPDLALPIGEFGQALGGLDFPCEEPELLVCLSAEDERNLEDGDVDEHEQDTAYKPLRYATLENAMTLFSSDEHSGFQVAVEADESSSKDKRPPKTPKGKKPKTPTKSDRSAPETATSTAVRRIAWQTLDSFSSPASPPESSAAAAAALAATASLGIPLSTADALLQARSLPISSAASAARRASREHVAPDAHRQQNPLAPRRGCIWRQGRAGVGAAALVGQSTVGANFLRGEAFGDATVAAVLEDEERRIARKKVESVIGGLQTFNDMISSVVEKQSSFVADAYY